ncbi:MAG: NADH-quinone oxidoreductase subunit NuoN [Gammaproteobacteria bacterium]|nr:NADH-quinone oxidoreductase subunit NuoN [Gammaproteobacteria bacterium]
MPELKLILPELSLLALLCCVLLIDVFKRGRSNDWTSTFGLSVASLLIVLVITATGWQAERIAVFGGMYIADPLATSLKVFILSAGVFALFYSRDYLARRGIVVGEYYVLALSSVLGMMILVSAGNLLTVYLGLELMSLSLYAMVAMQRDASQASEAAMKYFVLGALASGMLLYGISLMYGVSGTLDIATLAHNIGGVRDGTLVVFAMVFVLCGVAFKLGVVPFHMWVPDVYQGAAAPVALFISTAPKIAAFGMVMRILVEGLSPMRPEWSAMLAILAVLSMAIGNVTALAQTNFKRLLAYSTISHMGFLLLGVIAGTNDGYAASMFYAVVYALMSLAAFGALILICQADAERDETADFAGFAKTSPGFALLVMMVMFSLAGVPPFAGFWAKWFVIKEVLAAGYLWLAIVSVLFSVIGAFYYLRIVKLMYFDNPDGSVVVGAGSDMRAALSFNGLVILALGLLPTWLMTICLVATRTF